jgi:hypothetical protein
MSPDDLFSNAVLRMDDIALRQEKELQKLLTQPTHHDVAQALMDSFLGNLLVLFNYEKATWGNGQGDTDIAKVYENIMVGLEKDYKKLTGRDYAPPIVRQARLSKENKG